MYKRKYNGHGNIDKHKARLVTKGYSQKRGINYIKVRMIIALALHKSWKIFQLDVKSAFLHGELNEDIYVEQPKGNEKRGSEHLV